MKYFILSLYFCLFFCNIQAQWFVLNSGDNHKLLVSKANNQLGIYKNIPSEIILEAKNGKTLKLTSSNASITQNSNSSYTISCKEDKAIVQIYSVKKSKMKLLAEVSIPIIDLPNPNQLFLRDDVLILGYEIFTFFQDDGSISPYDSIIMYNEVPVNNSLVSFGTNQASFYGYEGRLSEEVKNLLKYAPSGTAYNITAYYTKADGTLDFFTSSMITTEEQIKPVKYVVLNNTPQNKHLFDEKDPSSLVGFLRNNYGIIASLDSPHSGKTTYPEGEFLGVIYGGLVPESINSLNIDLSTNQHNLKPLAEVGEITEKYIINSENQAVPVYHAKGSSTEVKYYLPSSEYQWTIDETTETTDENEAERDDFGNPLIVTFRSRIIKFAYTLDSIQQIIIRYDSISNISKGIIEMQPTQISFARKFSKNSLSEIVFSIKVRDLLKLESYAPTIHFKNEIKNSTYFTNDNPSTLLGYLCSNEAKELHIASFPRLNLSSVSEFGDDCDPNGKIDSSLIETFIINEEMAQDKILYEDGIEIPVYVKKGHISNAKKFEYGDPMISQLDEATETIDSFEAEISPITGGPETSQFLIQYTNRSQFRGFTDLFIKRKYLFDPHLGVSIAKPIALGYAQRMPNQAKPTLIMQVDLSAYQHVSKLLPNLKTEILIAQPWALTIFQNETVTISETISGNDITTLQKKFQFRKIMESLDGKLELSNVPHF